VGWLDSLAVPKTAPNVGNAKTFINWISRVDNATQQFNYYGHPVGVKIDASKATHKPEDSPEINPTVPVKFTKACSPVAQALVDKVWTQLLQ
jgi:spermidine/putrescine transport system substrate-binding protein